MTHPLFPETTRQVIRLDAQPEPIVFDAANTAVIVVDMQNDFGAKGGMFDRAGIDLAGIQKAIGPTASVLAARAARASRSSISRWAFGPISQTWVLPTLSIGCGIWGGASANPSAPPTAAKVGF